MKNAGTILEPACLYADQGKEEVLELAKVVKEHSCRNAVIHFDDIYYLKLWLDKAKIAVVMDFPYGKEGHWVLIDTIHTGAGFGISNFDICINLPRLLGYEGVRFVQSDFQIVSRILNESWVSPREIKAIIQLPYLWQYAKSSIEPLVCALAESGVAVIKDWTTVHNFSRQVNVSLGNRLDYLDYVKKVIERNHLPLKIKIAGGVRPDNAVEFVKHGADMLGVSVQYVPDVIKVLESSEEC